MNLGQIEAIVNKLGGMEGVQRFLAGNSEVVEKNLAISEVFRLTVDYGKSFEQMIAAGDYDWKNDDITAKRFPIEGEGIAEFEARYFHSNRNISSEDAVKEIESADAENPWMPAKIEHVLSHGATFPEEQRKFPIIGLGSVAGVVGSRSVPCLFGDGSERRLDLGWWRSGCGVWGSRFRSLAVRKVSVP
ncbi:MAG: hypothetical protein WC798_01635 [Candidatus Paceibacterota bacterium]